MNLRRMRTPGLLFPAFYRQIMATFARALAPATMVLMLSALLSSANAASRIKDIATFEGVRDNLLVRYGLVVGLDGSGDSLRNAPFTRQALESMLERMGVNVRDNQYFFISVDDGPLKQITIDVDDSFGFLSFGIRKAMGTDQLGTALFIDDDIEGRFLRIQALNGHKIEILAGPENLDALVGLGLKPTVLFGEIADDDTNAPAASAFGLELLASINVLTKDGALDADTILENATRIVRKAHRFLTEGPEDPFEATGPASQLILARIASYQLALDRLKQSNPFGGENSALF